MAEGVRRDGAPYARQQGVFLDHLPDVLAAQALAGTVEEKVAALGRKVVTPEGQPLLQQIEHQGMERHQPVLGALARHQHQPPLHVHIRHQQVADLRDAQARRIEHLQQAAVTTAAFLAHVRQLQQAVHLGLAQDFRQILGQTRAFQQAGGIALQQAFFHRILEKAAQCRQAPGQRASRILPGSQPGQIQEQVMFIEAGLVAGIQLVEEKEKIFQILPV